MSEIWNQFAFISILLCIFFAVVTCSLPSNKTSSSSQGENIGIAPHWPKQNDKPATSSPRVDPSIGSKPRWSNEGRMQKRLHAEPAGNTVRFPCRADGDPTPTVEWFKDGNSIDKNGRIGGFRIRSNGLLILESVVPADNGLYTCIAANKYGSINHTYELDVQERAASRPLLQLGVPKNRTAVVGDNVTFRCKVYSDPHPHVKWVRHIQINGSWVNPETKSPYVVVLKESGINEADVENLRLENVTEAESGKYTCIAENYIGKESNSAWLTVYRGISPG